MKNLQYLPAPFLYGLVNELLKDKGDRFGMFLLMFWSLWGVVGKENK